MRWGVYSRENHPAALAFGEGLLGVGVRPVFRSLSDYGNGCVEKFDAVMVLGLRGKGARILAEYQRVGIPVVVVDYGYLQRVNGIADWLTGHWQVSLGGLNRVVPFACPADRFNALGLAIATGTERASPSILCVQHPGDAAHPFDTQDKLDAWIASVECDEMRRHPLDGESEPLADMLSRAGRIITWNSNIGHDALLAGVPVTALGDAPYQGVAGDARAEYFSRVAFSQWTVAELATGEPQRFLIDHVIPNIPFAAGIETARRRGRQRKAA